MLKVPAVTKIRLPLQKGRACILITIDANYPVTDATVEKFIDELNLHDFMASYLPDIPPMTYQHGSNKTDHICGTIGVMTSTIGAGTLAFGIGPGLDHPILYVDISLIAHCTLPFQSINDPTHPSSPNLRSTDVKAASYYVELVKHNCQMENTATHIAILNQRCNHTNCCTLNDEKILNKIDCDITKIMLRAERDFKRAKGHAWSPILPHAGKTVIAAKWHLSDVRLGQIPIPPGSHSKMIKHA
jgi:hypothetical protein